MSPSSHQLRYGRMLYDFDAANETELTAKDGDVIIIVEDHGDGWSTCSLVNSPTQQGFIPTTYFEDAPDYLPPVPTTLTTTTTTTSTPPAVKKVEKNFDIYSLPSISSVVGQRNTVSLGSVSVSAPSSSGEDSPMKTPPINIKKRKESRGPVVKSKLSENEAKEVLKKQMKIYMIKLKLRQYCKSNDFKQRRTRNELIRETVETERTYVKHLTNFVNLVYLPMKRSTKKVIKEDKLKILFSNVEQILSINSMLLADMEKAMASWPESKIGAVLLNIAPFFKTYTTYVNNYDNAFEMYELLLKKKPKFREFLNENVYNNPATERYKFDSYLILPVQRIPRYRMLIEDILKNTPTDHTEYENLKKAVDMISEVASFVNEGKRQNENSNVIMDLSKLLKDRYKTLVQPNRKFVRESTLVVRSAERGINNDSYKAYLFGDVIVLYENKQDSMFMRTKKSAHFIFLGFSKVVSTNSPDSAEFSIETLIGGDFCRFTFLCGSVEEAKQWRADTEELISQIQKNNELRGIAESVGIAKERIDLSGEAKQTLKKCGDIVQEFRQSEQNLLRLDNELRRDQEELRRLQEKIAREKQEIAQFESILDQLEVKQKQETEVLNQQFAKLREKDATVFYALKDEYDAFRQVFGEDPSSEDMHYRLIPPAIIRQRRMNVDQIGTDGPGFLDTARNRMTLPPPNKLVPPNKAPPKPPTASKPKPPPKPPVGPSSFDERRTTPVRSAPLQNPSALRQTPPPSELARSSSAPVLPQKPARSSLPTGPKAPPKPLPNAGLGTDKPQLPPKKLPTPNIPPATGSKPEIVYRKKLP